MTWRDRLAKAVAGARHFAISTWYRLNWEIDGWRQPPVRVAFVEREPRYFRRNMLYVTRGAAGPAFLACRDLMRPSMPLFCTSLVKVPR